MNNDNITRLSESERNLSRDDDNYLSVVRLEWDRNLTK